MNKIYTVDVKLLVRKKCILITSLLFSWSLWMCWSSAEGDPVALHNNGCSHCFLWPSGLMDKASASGAGDCGFKSHLVASTTLKTFSTNDGSSLHITCPENQTRAQALGLQDGFACSIQKITFTDLHRVQCINFLCNKKWLGQQRFNNGKWHTYIAIDHKWKFRGHVN